MKRSLITGSRTKARGLLLLALFVSILTPVSAQRNASPQRRQTGDKRKVERDRLRVEEELRVALRVIRKAIDEYRTYCESGMVGPLDRKVDDFCYPPNLQVLVTGIKPPNGKVKIRFLRRIPIDPTTGKREWGLRSMQDEPNATKWGGQNVFDVYCLNKGTAMDGSKYFDW